MVKVARHIECTYLIVHFNIVQVVHFISVYFSTLVKKGWSLASKQRRLYDMICDHKCPTDQASLRPYLRLHSQWTFSPLLYSVPHSPKR